MGFTSIDNPKKSPSHGNRDRHVHKKVLPVSKYLEEKQRSNQSRSRREEKLSIKQRNNGFLEYLLLSAPPRKEMNQYEKRKNRRATKESMEAMIVILRKIITKELMQER